MKKIWVAGETGMVGRALIYQLKGKNYEVISAPHTTLDLTHQQNTYAWLQENKPDIIIMAAGRVGGIGANANDRAGFLWDNAVMAQNVIHGAYSAGVEQLLYLGSSCIYPKDAPQPIVEEALLSGALEPTNEGYALAKILGVKLCEHYSAQYGVRYSAVMPANLFGRHDHFDAEKSHVIPALILKIHHAKIAGAAAVTLWGTGTPLREFLYVDDLAKAILFLLDKENIPPILNIGSGVEMSIAELAQKIKKIIGFEGEIIFDDTKPDGIRRKLLECTKLKNLGWDEAGQDFDEALQDTYDWFLTNIPSKR